MNLLEKLAKNYFIALPIVILVVYIKIITFDFSGFGNDVIIPDNFERISNFSGLVSEFSEAYPGGNDYKPLTMVSFYFNALLAGQNLYIYLLTNIFLHIIVCLLLFRFLNLLDIPKTASFFGALIFSIHPLIAGNVSLMSSVSILLMSTFGLLGMIYCINYFKSRSSAYIWLSGLFVLLSILSDFSGYTFSILVILYSVVFHNREFKENFNIIIAPLLCVVIIWFLLYLNVDTGSSGNILNPDEGIISVAGIYINTDMFKLLPEIAGKFLLPIQISTLPFFSTLSIITGFIILIGLSIFTFLKSGSNSNLKQTAIFSLAFLFIGVLFASVNLVNLDFQIYDYLTKFTYLPFLGFIILVSITFSGLNINFSNRYNNVLLFVIVAILSFVSYFNLSDYKSELEFFESASDLNSNNPKLQSGLIDIYLKNGNIDKAISLVEQNDKNIPGNSEVLLKIGDYYYKNQNYNKAIIYLEKVRESDKMNKPNLNLLINSYYSQKNYDKAIDILTSIASDTVKFSEARWDLFSMYIESKKFDNAIEFGKKSFTTENDILRALQIVESWSKLFYKENDNVSVVKVMKIGLELDPDNAVILEYLYSTYSSIGLKAQAKEYDSRLKKIFKEQNQSNQK